MRLTLRTLLAYLDDILEPAQAREIGEKLNESSLASSLVSRIREVMRRRRLTAPTLSGPGVGIDPNAVAEYLDNTLSPDGIADVEKICLESDVHVAEVAACHQILTLALGEPVEVPSQTRERMHALGPAAAKIAVASAPASKELPSSALNDVLSQAESLARSQTAMNGSGPLPTRENGSARRELPDYLRRKSSWKGMVSFVAVVVVAFVWGILVLQKFPFSPAEQSTSPELAATGDAAPDQNLADGAERDRGDQAAARRDETRSAAAVARPSGDEAGPDAFAGDPAAAAGTESAVASDLPLPAEEPQEDVPAFRRRPSSATDLADMPPAGDAAPDADTEKAKKGDAPETEPVPAVVKPAIYTSSEGITLNYLRSQQGWYVLPRRALVHPGDQLAVPDPFEGSFEFEEGRGLITLQGRTALRWLDPTEAAPTSIELRRGQVALRATTVGGPDQAPLRVGMIISGESWLFELQPGTTVGIDFVPVEPTGFERDPVKGDYSGGIYVAAGNATIVDPYGRGTGFSGRGWLKFPVRAPASDGAEKPPASNPPLITLPKWMGQTTPLSAERQAARIFEKKFKLDEPVELSLPALADDPNAIMARMATDCLGLIEAYRALVNVLQRSRHDESRRSAIAGLRLWLPRNPENRSLLQAELAQAYPPEEAEIVYRLLWGYDTADARNMDIAVQLLEWMGNPEVSIRELAFTHVFRLTGKTFDYRASNKPTQLQQSLRHWQSYIQKEGGLLPPLKDAAAK
jgi:hypothetical protein